MDSLGSYPMWKNRILKEGQVIWSSMKNQGKRREKDKRRGKRKGEERFVQKVQRVRLSREMKGQKGVLITEEGMGSP